MAGKNTAQPVLILLQVLLAYCNSSVGTLGHLDIMTLGRWDIGTLGRWDVGTLGRWDHSEEGNRHILATAIGNLLLLFDSPIEILTRVWA
jgi:hypothetical protein